MFASIAGRYDFLNHALSLGLDRRWRRRAVRELAPAAGARVLDLCGGTGDLTVELARSIPDGWVLCCDFCPPMLARAVPKFRRKGVDDRCGVLGADGLHLPFPDGTFDGVTVAFGVRNFADMGQGLRETRRVLVAGGKLVVLEFSTPHAPVLSQLYRFYLGRVLPRLGDSVSGTTGPYGYLARTIADFPAPDLLAGQIREAGFGAVGWVTLTGGVVAIHTAFK
jgi:demethylmenaquinone methyltransferase/2-methoxy-6-polyprenyl-1,4-benzoquinol methylase